MITSAIVISPFYYLIVYVLKKKFGWFQERLTDQSENNSTRKKIKKSENRSFEEVPSTDRSVLNNSFNDIIVN